MRSLVIMAKQPQPGNTKTRLCPPMTPVAAADLYHAFLLDVLVLARRAADNWGDIALAVAYAPADATEFFLNIAPDFDLVPQTGVTLAERLDGILDGQLRSGYGQVVALSSDSPSLPEEYLLRAFKRLEQESVDVVLGPCEDGGYYLIGVKRHVPELVRDVQMSTPHVLDDTLQIAAQHELSVALLPSWYDVDTSDELTRLQVEADRLPGDRLTHTRKFLQQVDGAS